jgi:hypothetical protein
VHYDSEDEDMHGDVTIDSYLEKFEEASDSCALVEVTLVHLRRIVTLMHWRDSWMDRMLAPLL